MQDPFSDRIHALLLEINKLDGRARLDLKKMFANCEKLQQDLANEAVNCRRRTIPSAKYQIMHDALDQNLTEIERYLLLAKLIS